MSPSRAHLKQCHTQDHSLSRRAFFGAGAGAAGLGLLQAPLLADQLVREQKRVLMIFLAGGSSQFETWDPKPGRSTGGPFQKIQTSIPGYHISELMPKMASQIHRHTAVIRSLEAQGNNNHDEFVLFAGKPVVAGLKMPAIGPMLARELADHASPVPHHVMLTNVWSPTSNFPTINYVETPGFYGSQWSPVIIEPDGLDAKPPFVGKRPLLRLAPDSNGLPSGFTDTEYLDRGRLRERFSQEFLKGRERDGVLMGHATGYARVKGLMDSARLFDVEQESPRVRDAYGPSAFGQQAIVARRLIEAGVPYVRLNFGFWDFHAQNFESHHEMVPVLDHVLTTLLDDLAVRGLLDHTLVVTFSEMGRSPQINASAGREHYRGMSVTLSGCGIKPGVIYGETNADGTQISKDRIDLNQFFATIFQAVGVDHQKEYHAPDGRPVPLTEYGTEPVSEVLA